ncbi:MAG: sulfatase-like hydrolase/transferase [Pirellulaceae bacterium]|nr:sulfatase-like hydrolase/transferase [Pirellulaceae bacterium]
MNTTALRLAALFLLLLVGNTFAATKPGSQPPYIVFLFADDLGGGDLLCYGHPYARTPNIDSRARDGTRFMQSYSTGADDVENGGKKKKLADERGRDAHI